MICPFNLEHLKILIRRIIFVWDKRRHCAHYSWQEAKESFASPDYLFYGKSHFVKLLYRQNGCKKPYLFAFNTTTRGNEPKWDPAQIDA